MPIKILSLPVELLLLIFKNLHDLDDLACLAATCRVLRDVYRPFKSRLLWSIIRNSDHHKYDAAICRFHDVMHGTECDTILQPPCGPLSTVSWMFEDYSDCTFDAEQHANGKGQTDRHLQRILTWWKQTTSIRKFYLTNFRRYHGTLGFMDPESIPLEQRHNYALALYLDQRHGVSGPINSIPSPHLAGKVVSKTRLYCAVMARFLDAKAAQFAKFCDPPETSERLFENVSKRWSCSPNRTLEESLEVLEAFDIVSNFMLLHTFDVDTLVHWASRLGREDYVDEAHNFLPDPNNTLSCTWMDVMTNLQPYLTPFDILSLVVKDKVDRDTLRYLARLLEPPHGEPPGMSDMEHDVMIKMKNAYQVSSRCWEIYRRHNWSSVLRGKLFCEDLDTAKIASSITEVGDNKCHWWQSLTAGEGEEYRFPIPSSYLTTVGIYIDKLLDSSADDSTEEYTLYTLSSEDQQPLLLHDGDSAS